MKMAQIKQHWQDMSKLYGGELYATSKTMTIKRLEIESLKKVISTTSNRSEVLEVGCGTGINCIELAKNFPESFFYGIDYIDEMISNANDNIQKCKANNVSFSVDDVLKLGSNLVNDKIFDIVYSVRCLINLNSEKLQKIAMSKISEHVKPGGYYLMLENSSYCYEKQNALREKLGLKKRIPAEYNLFLNDSTIIPYLENACNLKLIKIINMASLHDIFQYVIIPHMNSDNIVYENDIMNHIMEFELKTASSFNNEFGEYGQNRLYVLKKEVVL